MSTHIMLAAKELATGEPSDALTLLDWEPEQFAALIDEVKSVTTSPDNKHARAERGRIAVELFGFVDDVETMAADVIADILHWVALTSSPDHVAPAVFRGIGYFLEERS